MVPLLSSYNHKNEETGVKKSKIMYIIIKMDKQSETEVREYLQKVTGESNNFN
jgi:hypothetical protein